MRQLHFDLLRLLEGDRQGSHGTGRGRRYVLAQAAETLHRLGYQGLRAQGFKGRHVDALVAEVAAAGAVGRHGEESPGAPALAGAEDRQAGHRPEGQRKLRDRTAVRDLNWDLLRLQRRESHVGSHATRRDRSYALAQMANALHELGFRGLRAEGLKPRHVEALVRHWRDGGLSHATMMNRMAHVRCWAGRVGKAGMVGNNADYGIQRRSHVSDGTRRRDLDRSRLARVRDAHVRMALRLQAAFGLRREEAIKFCPSHADRGDRVLVKASTAKGGRPRHVPVRTEAQRRLLDEARQLAGGGALIPPARNYAEQRRVYEGQTRAAGLDRSHGLRHAYALDRYEGLCSASIRMRSPRQSG